MSGAGEVMDCIPSSKNYGQKKGGKAKNVPVLILTVRNGNLISCSISII